MTPFTTLVADPPWPYNDKLMSGNSGFGQARRQTRGAANHYPVMSLQALHALRPQDVMAENAHCYLWTTNAFMSEAHDLMRSWDFTQKTILTWVKPQIGMGWYYRNNTEHVLFGTRGTLRTLKRNVPTGFVAPRIGHSVKPDSFYAIVETMSPGPYLELFARAPRQGWTVLGNAIDGRLIETVLAEWAATG